MTELTIDDDIRAALIEAACRVRENAYAPYSNYAVGAAILVEDGRIISGVNVENASYGATVCAERSAMFTAVTEGYRTVYAVAVCTENGVAPCGPCRQVLSEFAGPDGDIPVWMVNSAGKVQERTLSQLLPDAFGSRHLG